MKGSARKAIASAVLANTALASTGIASSAMPSPNARWPADGQRPAGVMQNLHRFAAVSL
jgi:hypothetical protein